MIHKKQIVRSLIASIAIIALAMIPQIIHTGRGGGIAAGVFGGMLAGSMLANAANQGSSSTTYYIENPTPAYDNQSAYQYSAPYANQQYQAGYNQPYDNDMDDERDKQLAGLAEQNRQLRNNAQQAKKAYQQCRQEYDGLKQQYEQILASGREYKRKFLSLERRYAILEEQYHTLQLQYDVLEDKTKGIGTSSAKEKMANDTIMRLPRPHEDAELPALAPATEIVSRKELVLP